MTAVDVRPPRSRERADRLERIWEERPGLLGWLTTVDHKRIGLLYLFTTLAFFGAGGIEALLIRTQLAGANGKVLGPDAYNQAMTMHGVTMIFFFIVPIGIGAFGNYLIPLMIGARDMAFPRMNALSYWIFLASGLFLYSSVFLGKAPSEFFALVWRGAFGSAFSLQNTLLRASPLLLTALCVALPAHLGGFDRLAVDTACRRGRRASRRHTHLLTERSHHPGPGAVAFPALEVIVHGAPRREVSGQHPPGATRTVDVEQGIDDLPQIHGSLLPPFLRPGHERLDELPLGVA